MKIIHNFPSIKSCIVIILSFLALPAWTAQLSGLVLQQPLIKQDNAGFKNLIVKYLLPTSNSSDYFNNVDFLIDGKKIMQLKFNQQVIIPLPKNSNLNSLEFKAIAENSSQKCKFQNKNRGLVTCIINPIKEPETKIQLSL
jgi:hypothetical protein